MLLGDASVCSEKMASPGERSFCVLVYHTSKSMVTVQRAFRAKHAKAFVPPLSCDLAYLKARIIAAVKNIGAPMLMRVWQELEYRIDVCRVTRGDTSNISSCKKNFFSCPVTVNNSIEVGPLVILL